jgi:hypothetical protein
MASKHRNHVTAQPKRCCSADRTDRFIARVDAYLATLADDAARRLFLDSQLEGWERRYARFVATQGASEFAASAGDPPQAADFLLTISALAARRGTLRRHYRGGYGRVEGPARKATRESPPT